MNTFQKIAVGIALLFAPLISYAAQPLQGSLGSRAQNVLMLGTNMNDAETFTINGTVYELDFNRTTVVTNGVIAIRLGTNGTRATRVLTFTNNAVNRDTWTIAGKVYQADTTLTNTDGHVLIGADAAMTISNLSAAINLDSGSGSRYAAATTANSNVYASSLTSSTLTISADASGSQGNLIAVGRAWGTNTGWATGDATGAATMTGGAGAKSATDPYLSTNIVAGFNVSNRQSMAAQVINTNELLFFNLNFGASRQPVSETIAGASWSTNVMNGGVNGDPFPVSTAVIRVPTANEVTLGQMHWVFPFSPRVYHVQVITTTGGGKFAWDGAVTVTGNRLTVDNSGSQDFGATNTFHIFVSP